MWEARNRRSSDRRLEARLRSARPEADEAFVRTIAGAVEPRRAPRAWSRVAFAGAFTTLLVGMFASFGGISYAASGATSAVHTLTKIAKAEKVVVHHSAAANQYGAPGGDQNNQAPASQNQAPASQNQAPASQTQGAEAAQGVQAAQSGTLPFTGISLLATMLLGLAMVVTGLALRRRERDKAKARS
jgi:type VI protein secretion system component VasF